MTNFTQSVVHDPRGNSSPRVSSNSEASASELLENLEEMFPRCHMDSDVISRFKFSVLPIAKGLKHTLHETVSSPFLISVHPDILPLPPYPQPGPVVTLIFSRMFVRV